VSGVTVVKYGGELLESPERLAAIASDIAEARRSAPRIAIVHGGGRTIDAMLGRMAIEPRMVNGLRITDPETLDVVVAVLAGLINTRFVAALNAAGTPAVGLTGVDARLVPVRLAPSVRDASGAAVSLGRVGVPADDRRAPADAELALHLIDTGYVPVIASVSADSAGQLLNVNGDTFAAALSIALRADQLIVAGTTPGVLDGEGVSIQSMDVARAELLIGEGAATAGMIAKLRACIDAVQRGVGRVLVAGGSDVAAILGGRGSDRATVIRPALAHAGGIQG
jgi:acetylglutamate kinase